MTKPSHLGEAALFTAGIAIVLFFEWHTDEPLVVLPVLLTVSFTVGLIAPRSFVRAGLILGWCIFAAHLLSNASGLMIPQYQHSPPKPGDWIAMALLVFPALAASFAGSRILKLVAPDRAI